MIAAFLIALSACKKESVNTGGKLTPVTFNVSYQQSSGGFDVAKQGKLNVNSLAVNAVDSTLKANADVLYALIYQSDGTRFFTIKQLSTDTVFGKITINLPQGNYTVAFMAGKTGLIASPASGGQLSSDVFFYSTQVSPPDTRFQDAFYSKMNVTVGSSGFSQTATLSRVVSQIIVNIEDAIPPNVKFWSFSATDNTGGGIPQFKVSTNAAIGDDGFLYTNTPFATPVTTGVKNARLAIMVLNTARPYTVHILASNTLQTANQFNGTGVVGDLIAEATVPNVTVQPNHQTIVSGKLFGGNGTVNSGNFTITVDPTWDPTPTTIPFQ